MLACAIRRGQIGCYGRFRVPLNHQKRFVAAQTVRVDIADRPLTAPAAPPAEAALEGETTAQPQTATAATATATSNDIRFVPEGGSPSPSSSPSPAPPNGPAAAPGSGGPSDDPYPLKVADLDAQRFRLHPSVQYWQTFKSAINTMWVESDFSLSSLQQLLESARESGALRDPRAAAYWSYHSARMTFFFGQAFAGLTAHHLSETLPGPVAGWLGLPAGGGSGTGGAAAATTGTNAASGGQGGQAPGAGSTPLQRILSNVSGELGSRAGEALGTFQQDFDNIRAGYYSLPWDMDPRHRQNSPLFMMRRTGQSLVETAAVLQRRVRGQPEPLWLSSGLYPDYYTRTFHFQTDGWFSHKSARIYEHMTEVLFTGRQDAMQRTSLLPLADFMREAQQAGRSVRELRLLEVAAGTGRFHTFIKDAYPDLPSVLSDLSPYYLEQARSNMRYWKGLRQPNRRLGGADDTGVDFLQTAAEALDAPNESFDVVVSVYLFHELPEEVRRAAAAEFFRVLRPGGLLVLTDSVQSGDRPAWDHSIGVFGNFNEPYYRSYLATDLGAMFEAAGFVCDTKYLCSASKTLSFRKPGSLQGPDAA